MAGGTLGGGHGRRGQIITEINVTPLVDIMLVLLIIFMVTTTTMVMNALEVKLPEAATGETSKVTLLAVVIKSDGTVFLNGKKTSEGALREFIRSERRLDRKLEAVIAADKRVAHGNVVRILDLVRSEGVIKFAISVLKKQGAE
jgi:biopolymer transport protein ExbD